MTHKLITKALLIILSGLICFHFSFISSERLTSSAADLKIVKATYSQYQNYLKAIYYPDEKLEFIANTRSTYIFNLQKEFTYFIYLGYFIIISIFILISKFSLTREKNN